MRQGYVFAVVVVKNHLTMQINNKNSRVTTATVGFIRIGDKRQLKRALEAYWNGKISQEELIERANKVESDAWQTQSEAKVAQIGVGDFSLYDHVLDWTYRFGLINKRFRHLKGLDQYFAMARGTKGFDGHEALDMTKWFDMNYHYLQPVIDRETLKYASSNLNDYISRIKRAITQLSVSRIRPIILGPMTYLALARLQGGVTMDSCLDYLIPIYRDLLKTLKSLGIVQVQLHEPILATSKGKTLKKGLERVLGDIQSDSPSIDLVSFFDDVGEDMYSWIVNLPIAKISLDLSRGNNFDFISKFGFPKTKVLGAGIISGRNVWRVHPERLDPTISLLRTLTNSGVNVVIQPSCSLQHVPFTKTMESKSIGCSNAHSLYPVLSFAVEKLEELTLVKNHIENPSDKWLDKCFDAWSKFFKANSPIVSVKKRLEGLTLVDFERKTSFKTRSKIIADHLPRLPTTTIGSFPQTKEVRRLRVQLKRGHISLEAYRARMIQLIAHTVGVQEGLELDIIVHGEMERTDMVEYFGLQLNGIAFTAYGWVQSYGSRCVRPPIIYADVTRPSPMTLWEFKAAQSMTEKPVKGMLTGPITILSWSFPREDVSEETQAMQLALCIRDEVADLEKSGAVHIQVDEPGLREMLPLRDDKREGYLKWAVNSFRLATGIASASTCIHTHMCYAEFADVMGPINDLNADVISIENARSGNETIEDMLKYGYVRYIGPGVYDIHSPSVPSVEFLTKKIQSFLSTGLDPRRLVINPDCGLKTRKWPEVIPALRNMVQATKVIRIKLENDSLDLKPSSNNTMAEEKAKIYEAKSSCRGQCSHHHDDE